MPIIKSFKFERDWFHEFNNLQHGSNWPVVYIIHNWEEAYVGQTTNIIARSKQHYMLERRRLGNIEIISDETYNISAVLDTESLLIQYMVADGKFKLQNWNYGISNHQYYEKDKYIAKFEYLWDTLMKDQGLANNNHINIKNSDIFKYSPYKALSLDQITIATEVLQEIVSKKEHNSTQIISWKPGTWKTILAIYLIKRLLDSARVNNLKIGFVVPMTSLRKTIKNVFRSIKGLKSSMVIGPSDVVNTDIPYDILIVDEAHRLKQRRNIVNFASFDDVNRKLGLDHSGTELDWILMSSKHQILFYDVNQSIRPSDIWRDIFTDLNAKKYELTTQLRVKWGENFMKFVENSFDNIHPEITEFQDYDFIIYDDIWKMVSDIKRLDTQYWLCRLVAWYAWAWVSQDDKTLHDIEIWNTKLQWNSITQDWINSSNAINEVWCIHTVQWYDLNYIGVIIWPELSYDFEYKKFIINKEQYQDKNGYRGIENDEELKNYILNIYKTIMTRWILWCYVYIVDENLRAYFYSKLRKL